MAGVSVSLGAGVVVGRLLYSLGYTQIGARARTPGAIVLDLSGFSLTGLAMYACWHYAGGGAALMAPLWSPGGQEQREMLVRDEL